MTSFSGQTKKETIQKEYGWTQHQWERFLHHTQDEAKELFYTHKYWTNTEKPDDVTWDDLEGDVIEWFIEEVNKRLVKCRIQVDYKLIKWRLLPLLRRKPNGLVKRMTGRKRGFHSTQSPMLVGESRINVSESPASSVFDCSVQPTANVKDVLSACRENK